MSPQSSGNAAKQGLNVYTMMLALSFVALTIGAILLYLELNNYGSWPQWKDTGGTTAPVAAPVATPEPEPEPTAYVAPDLVPEGTQRLFA
ncbi:MAG: hypothetical protein ACKVH8_01440 [Pirellulales bacterium]|jgi:hypothetical protein